jgi:hypothetical protein
VNLRKLCKCRGQFGRICFNKSNLITNKIKDSLDIYRGIQLEESPIYENTTSSEMVSDSVKCRKHVDHRHIMPQYNVYFESDK